MSRYLIVCDSAEYFVIADDVNWDGNGLKFFRKDEITAYFARWDLWINLGVVNENQ